MGHGDGQGKLVRAYWNFASDRKDLPRPALRKAGTKTPGGVAAVVVR
jgi:hypothetical protein